MKGMWKWAAVMAVGAVAWGCVEPAEEGVDVDETVAEEGAPGEPEWSAQMEGPALQVDSLEGMGPYLTDASGRALYLLEEEPQDSSICYDECAEEWPPLLAEQGSPRAEGEGIDEAMISTIERRDGQMQVTYAGHPLYYYHDDEGPGDTLGQDLTDAWGEWYLVRPDGEPLEEGG